MTTTDPNATTLSHFAAPNLTPAQTRDVWNMLLGRGDQSLVPRMKQALAVATLAELAARVGAPLSTVKGWSARGSVPVRWLRRCVKLSGCSAHWLLYGEEAGDAAKSQTPAVPAEAAAREWFGPIYDAFHS